MMETTVDPPINFDLLIAGSSGNIEVVPSQGELKPGRLPFNTVCTYLYDPPINYIKKLCMNLVSALVVTI